MVQQASVQEKNALVSQKKLCSIHGREHSRQFRGMCRYTERLNRRCQYTGRDCASLSSSAHPANARRCFGPTPSLKNCNKMQPQTSTVVNTASRRHCRQCSWRRVHCRRATAKSLDCLLRRGCFCFSSAMHFTSLSLFLISVFCAVGRGYLQTKLSRPASKWHPEGKVGSLR